MKKIILGLSAFLMVFHSAGQLAIGPIVGMHSGTTHLTIDKHYSYYSQYGWRIGAIADVQLSKHIAVRPMLTVAKYGYEATPLSLYGIFTYSAFLKNGSSFFIGAGPYAATSITKYKVQDVPGSGTVYVDLVKPLMIGAYANAGYKFRNGLFISVHYEQVLTNMLRKDVFGPMFKTQLLHYEDYGLSAGWLFNIPGKKTVKVAAEQKNN